MSDVVVHYMVEAKKPVQDGAMPAVTTWTACSQARVNMALTTDVIHVTCKRCIAVLKKAGKL